VKIDIANYKRIHVERKKSVDKSGIGIKITVEGISKGYPN